MLYYLVDNYNIVTNGKYMPHVLINTAPLKPMLDGFTRVHSGVTNFVIFFLD